MTTQRTMQDERGAPYAVTVHDTEGPPLAEAKRQQAVSDTDRNLATRDTPTLELARLLLQAAAQDGLQILTGGASLDAVDHLDNMEKLLASILDDEPAAVPAAPVAQTVRQQRWDRFAAAAISGLLAADDEDTMGVEAVAVVASLVASRMLEERVQQ